MVSAWNRHHDVLLSAVLGVVQDGYLRALELLLMSLEQELLCLIADLLSRSQDKVTWLPGFNKPIPP